jgi:hypothetical protein
VLFCDYVKVKYPSRNWALIDSRMKGEVVQVEEKRTKNPAAIQNISLKVVS